MKRVTFEEFRRLPAGTIYSAISPCGFRSGIATIGVAGGVAPEGWLLDPAWVAEHCDLVIGPKHFCREDDRIYILERDDVRQLRDVLDRFMRGKCEWCAGMGTVYDGAACPSLDCPSKRK